MPIFAKPATLTPMSTMNISLPDELKSFVDQQVQRKSYGSSSEYIRDLLRREQDREHLRQLILDGMASGRAGVADDAYFASLRQRIRDHTTTKRAVSGGPHKTKSRVSRGG